jgi:hypothetical protein
MKRYSSVLIMAGQTGYIFITVGDFSGLYSYFGPTVYSYV